MLILFMENTVLTDFLYIPDPPLVRAAMLAWTRLKSNVSIRIRGRESINS